MNPEVVALLTVLSLLVVAIGAYWLGRWDQEKIDFERRWNNKWPS